MPKDPIDCIRDEWDAEDADIRDQIKSLWRSHYELEGVVIYGGTP
jgi:hypothetical protein